MNASPISPASAFDRRHDPFGRADWRGERACSLLNANRRPDRHDDAQTREIFRYVKRLAGRPSAAMSTTVHRHWPSLAVAHRLHDQGGVAADEIEARLLAGEGFDCIAARTGVSAAVVKAYELAFFNVASSLTALDWLTQNVLQIHTWSPGTLTRSRTWKWIALAAGPLMLDLVIAEDLGREQPVVPDRQRIAAQARFCAREAVTPMTASASFQVMTEAATLFGWMPSDGSTSVRSNDATLKAHLSFLRLASRNHSVVKKQRCCHPDSVTKQAARQPASRRQRCRRTEISPSAEAMIAANLIVTESGLVCVALGADAFG